MFSSIRWYVLVPTLLVATGCTGKHNIPVLVMQDVAVGYDAGWYVGSFLGQYDGARKAFEEVISLAPEFAEAHHNLAVSLAHLGDWDASLAAFERALRINPSLELSAAGVETATRATHGESSSTLEIPRLCRQFHKLHEEGC
jgi:tetratricopeptide (TPR) repeat protein